jgi:hypothetical protein
MVQRRTAAGPARETVAPPDKIPIVLMVNGIETRLDVAPWTTLLDVLREHLDLTGTKKGCDHGQCARVPYWWTGGGSIPASRSR